MRPGSPHRRLRESASKVAGTDRVRAGRTAADDEPITLIEDPPLIPGGVVPPGMTSDAQARA